MGQGNRARGPWLGHLSRLYGWAWYSLRDSASTLAQRGLAPSGPGIEVAGEGSPQAGHPGIWVGRDP